MKDLTRITGMSIYGVGLGLYIGGKLLGRESLGWIAVGMWAASAIVALSLVLDNNKGER